jgi:hypothetical protein
MNISAGFAIDPAIFSVIEGILDGLTNELQARGLELPPNIQSDLDEIDSAARLAGGGSEQPPIQFVVNYPPRQQPSIQLAGGPLAAAGAAIGVAEAMMLALIAMFAILMIIQQAPAMSRALEDLVRKIQIAMASFLDSVRDSMEAMEDMVKQNSKAGMRCSAQILLFRTLSNELINLLTIPRGKDQLGRARTQKQLIETSDKWLAAMKDLIACLNGVDPPDVA